MFFEKLFWNRSKKESRESEKRQNKTKNYLKMKNDLKEYLFQNKTQADLEILTKLQY